MSLKEIDALGDWMDGLVRRHGLSMQLTSIWLQQRGFTKPRDLTQNEIVLLVQWARI